MIRKEKTLKNIAALAGIFLVSQWNGPLSYGQSAPDASASGKEASAPSVAASSVIYGTIFSSKDKKPLSSVPVALKNNGTGEVVTKKNRCSGSFHFLSSGTWQLSDHCRWRKLFASEKRRNPEREYSRRNELSGLAPLDRKLSFIRKYL